MEIIDGKDLVNMKFIKTEDGLLKEYKPQSRFIPKKENIYWYIDITGGIYSSISNEDMYDKYILNRQLVFRTKEEAKDYKWFLDKLDEYKHDFTIGEWKDKDIKKHILYFDYRDNKIYITYDTNLKFDCYYFTKENAEKFIEVVSEDRIKKYLFNVWE